MKRILLICLLIPATVRLAMAGKITGMVTDDKGRILPYASVMVKGTTKGTTTNNQGRYFLELAPGDYHIICQYVGYARQEKAVSLREETAQLDFRLSIQLTVMKEVVVRPGGEDPAYEIIRHAIKKRKEYENPLDSFTCEAYIKALIKTRKLPSRIFGRTMKPSDRQGIGVDSEGKGIIYLSESLTKIAFKKPDKIKLEVISGRESGTNGFGFNFPTFINFYNNNVNILITQINPRGFVSPIANGALNYYRYKYLGSFFEDGKEINKISVIPRRKFEPLFTGTINITDGDWRIHSVDLFLVRESQLEILDTLSIKQIHVPVTDKVWLTKDQIVYFTFNKFGVDATGNFLNVYSKYNIEPNFPRKYFNNVIAKYDTAVNKKSKAYWDSLRPVQLEPEEIRDYHYKDSLFISQRDSAGSQRVMDSLRREQAHITVGKILFTGFRRRNFNPKRPFSFGWQPLLTGLQYNTVEGVAISLADTLDRFLPGAGIQVSLVPHVRYGFENTHFNAWGTLTLSKKSSDMGAFGGAPSGSTWTFSGGQRVSQFNKEEPISALMNSIYTLVARQNYMKIYQNRFAALDYLNRTGNGLRVGGSLLYEDRTPLNNTSNYSFFGDQGKPFTPNYPFEKINTQFSPHHALIAGVSARFKPGQQYIEFPNNKMALGSKYPTLSIAYEKGLYQVLGSDVDFDKWKFSLWDDVNFKLRGTLRYRLGVGGFLNNRRVYIQDYQHFNGNQILFASEYMNSFQIAPYYANSTIAPIYAVGHIEHHFNGMLTNKIPLFRRLNWNLLVGSNAFYVNQSNNYVEVFGGLENIFKLFRVDLVGSYLNGRTGLLGVRVGLGGLFGTMLAAGPQAQAD
jgi:hypothetical protein